VSTELTDDVGAEPPGIQLPEALVLVDLGVEISNTGQVQEVQGILRNSSQRLHLQP
jgi:hypothetical protein